MLGDLLSKMFVGGSPGQGGGGILGRFIGERQHQDPWKGLRTPTAEQGPIERFRNMSGEQKADLVSSAFDAAMPQSSPPQITPVQSASASAIPLSQVVAEFIASRSRQNQFR